MAPGEILEPLRRTLSRQQRDKSNRLTQPTNSLQQQTQPAATFDDDDAQINLTLDARSNSTERENDGHRTGGPNADQSNRWQWIHYYQNNTQFKLTPTFNDHLENVTENLDYQTIELMKSHGDHQMGERATGATNKTRSIIESIKSKLIIRNRLQPNRAANRPPIGGPKPTPAISMDHLAQLSCDSGEMVISLNFTDPFKGVVYPDHNRLSPCRFFGDGHHNYELRLPLRGCGTRQVAPRVFVNDVIVRFHKTLELEEDEVKTLICRYPPPLDAANLGAGSGLLHGLADSNRPSLASAGEPHSGHQPFELVDPFSGRPTANGLGASGQQQAGTFGELLAPSSGRQRAPNGDLLPGANLSPADRILSRQPNSNNEQLLSTPSSGVKQLNSRLFQLDSPTRFGDQRTSLAAATPSSSASLFERLSSVELLFLISSLMFLVLLAAGLAGGYYCFNRRRGRRESPASRSAPKLLARHRRRQAYLGSPSSLLAGGAASSVTPISRPNQQLYGLGTANAQQQTLHNVYGLSEPGSYYHQYLQQSHAAGPSSPDDSDISGQNLLPASNGIEPTTRRVGDGYRAPPSAHYQSSTLKPNYQQQYRQQAAVVGRRQVADPGGGHLVTGRRPAGTILRSSALDLSSRHPNQQQQAPLVVSTLGRRAARPNLAQQPLINLDNNVHYQYQNQCHNSHDDAQPTKRADLSETTNQANKTIAANLYYAQMRHANSLQQLRDHHPEVLGSRAPNDRQRQSYLNDDKIRQKQQQHFFDTSTLTRANAGRAERKESAELRVLDLSKSSSSASSASDSEIELTNENSARRPRLILKSIEDSFVTNLTEIYEQEYKKRDNTRPLSLVEWSLRQPNQFKANAANSKNCQVDVNYDDDEDEHGQLGQSSQTNLRSLTELDVNFAKSLLRPTLNTAQSKEETKAVPVGPSGQKHAPTSSSEKRQETTRADNAPDDLIISPEYSCGQLKLTKTDGDKKRTGAHSPAGDSHESISYV